MSDLTAHIRLADPDVDPERLDDLTRTVLAELRELPVSDAALNHADAPDGARALDGAVIGELVVALGSTAAVVKTVIEALRAWRDRNPARTVELRVGKDRLKLADATPEQQDQVVQAFVAALREH